MTRISHHYRETFRLSSNQRERIFGERADTTICVFFTLSEKLLKDAGRYKSSVDLCDDSLCDHSGIQTPQCERFGIVFTASPQILAVNYQLVQHWQIYRRWVCE